MAPAARSRKHTAFGAAPPGGKGGRRRAKAYNPAMHEANASFPKLIRLPAVDRPLTVSVDTLREVQSADDLPSRLLLGDLLPDSFQIQKKGWSADWRDADGHRTHLRYAGHLSSLELAYGGDEVVTLISVERFADIAQSAQAIHPGAWLATLAGDLEDRLNLRVFPHREDDAVVADFPDGHLLSLILPVPADRLPALFEVHKAMQADAAIRSGIDAYLRYGLSVVNYIEGRTHPMLNHPAGVVLHHVNALGTPAVDMPVRELDEDGVAAWTLQRNHYLYVAHCRLREVTRLIARLHAGGFIAAAGGEREGYPESPEFAAALLPYGYEYAVNDAWWFDKGRTRRVFYPRFADPTDRTTLGADSGEMWLKALMREAAKAAEQCKADAARAFAEGLATGGGTRQPLPQAH